MLERTTKKPTDMSTQSGHSDEMEITCPVDDLACALACAPAYPFLARRYFRSAALGKGTGVQQGSWREWYRRASLAAVVSAEPLKALAALKESRRPQNTAPLNPLHAARVNSETPNHAKCTNEDEAEATALLLGAKVFLNDPHCIRGNRGFEVREGANRALEMAEHALLLTKGSPACPASARAHEAIAIAHIKLIDADMDTSEHSTACANDNMHMPSSVSQENGCSWEHEHASFIDQHYGVRTRRYGEALRHLRAARALEPMDVGLAEREALVLSLLGLFPQVFHLLF